MKRVKGLLKKFLYLIVILVIVAIVAVQLTKRPIEPSPDIAPLSIPDVSPDIASKISFRIVITATASAPEAGMFEGGSWTKTRQLAHSAMLICHPDGLIIFDTGLGREVLTQFADFPFMTRQMVKFELTSPLVEQVNFESFCPGRAPEIILSHLHWDHAGGVEDFSALPVWAVPGALDAANEGGEQAGFLPSQLDAEILWKDLSFDDAPYASYPASKDIFGDSTVVVVPMPGHTIGSVGLFVTVGGEQLFLTGDTSWALEGFEIPAHKFALMRGLADGDLDTLDGEILRVHALMQAIPSLVVIPAHDVNAYPDWTLTSD